MSLQLPCYDPVLFRVGGGASKPCVALRRLAVRAHRSDRGEPEREQEECAPARLRAARRGRGPAAKKKKRKEEKTRRRGGRRESADDGSVEHLLNGRRTGGVCVCLRKRGEIRTCWLPGSAFPGIRILLSLKKKKNGAAGERRVALSLSVRGASTC